MTRQYIGARYVPKFYNNSVDGSTTWQSNVVYEPLTYVTLTNGHMYISKKEVPATVGTPANNVDYWLDIGSYNGFIDQLQNEIDTVELNVQNLAADVNKIKGTYVTPEAFGAVGDGITDDSTAIATASQYGVLIGNPEKTYRIEHEIVLQGDTFGVNFNVKDGVFIRASDNTNHINDTFETPLAEVQNHSGRGSTQFYISSKKNVTLENCKFLRGTNFVGVANSENITIKDCLFYRAYQTAYDQGGNGYAIIVTDGNNNIKITNNTFKSIGRHCIYITRDDTTQSSNKNVIICNNIFDWSNVNSEELPAQGVGGNASIQIRYSEHIIISNNAFKDVDGAIIIIPNADDLIGDINICNNTIKTHSNYTSNFAIYETAVLSGHSANDVKIIDNYIESFTCVGTINGLIMGNIMVGNRACVVVYSANTNQQCSVKHNKLKAKEAVIESYSSNNVIGALFIEDNILESTDTLGIYNRGSGSGNIGYVTLINNMFITTVAHTNNLFNATKAKYALNSHINNLSLRPCFNSSDVLHTFEDTFNFTP